MRCIHELIGLCCMVRAKSKGGNKPGMFLEILSLSCQLQPARTPKKHVFLIPEPQFIFLWVAYFCLKLPKMAFYFKSSQYFHTSSCHSVPSFYRWRNRDLRMEILSPKVPVQHIAELGENLGSNCNWSIAICKLIRIYCQVVPIISIGFTLSHLKDRQKA